jgi:hypothetical protein
MQHQQLTTQDTPAQYLTADQVGELARSCGQYAYRLGLIMGALTVRVRMGSFVRDFSAGDSGLFKAEPIRLWLGQ